MKRRAFSVEAARMLLGGAAIAVSGCGGGGSPVAADSPLTDAVASISENHGHSAVITAAQLREGGDLDLDIQGTSSHSHTVSLGAAEVASVRSGARVSKESSGSHHTHVVTFNG